MSRYEQHRLCDECNKNQEIKIKLLADFVPLDEANFYKEVTDFRYKLCFNCELLIAKVIDKPNSFRRSPLKPPTLHFAANDVPSNTATVDAISFASNTRRYGSFILPLFAHLAILTSLFYLFGLSNHSFIEPLTKPAKYSYFKRPFSMEHAKLYEQNYLLSVTTVLVLYASLVYFGRTFHLIIDSIAFGILGILIANGLNYNLFTLAHDSLMDLQQWLFMLVAMATLFNVVYFLYRIFKRNSVNLLVTDSLFNRKNFEDKDKEKRTFNFTKFEDESNQVKDRIKDLSLSDFDSNLGNGMKNVSSDRFNSPGNTFNPFSTYTTASHRLPQSKSYSFGQMIDSPRNISYIQCQFSKSDMFGSNMISSRSFFDKSAENSFDFKSQFGALKGHALLPGEQISRNEAHFCNKTQYQFGSPRILNYYVNCERPHESYTRPTVSSQASNWLWNMFHTFELILFLLIIALILVVLSMPITINYNSGFNSFDINILVRNMSET